ncbi:hypothetical protein BVRB_8g194090 [Beta vulgaris subsp. vulgaris]|nr:hypothetical protein BVRB_8g194090 [Beta vulgaris subsp. vulgaris]
MVGDALNWVEPPTSTTYSLWTSSNVFVKDDILVFSFNTGIHNVAEVTKTSYNNCNTSSLISLHDQSPVRIPLHKSGKRYFISSLNNDCQNGQKLAMNVLQQLPTPPPATSPSATPPPELAPGANNPALPLPAAAPNHQVVAPPPPSRNSAPSYFSPNISLLSVFVSLVMGLLCQSIV